MLQPLSVRIGFAVLWLCLLGSIATAEPALLSEIGSERATTGPGNNVVTHEGKTHVVWPLQQKVGWGLSSSVDGKSLVYIQNQFAESNLMLVRNFR